MADPQIQVRPIAGSLGAELEGVDLAKPLGEHALAEIRRALLEHAVVFFRGQSLTRVAQLEFARRLGEPEVHPIANGLADHPEVIRVWKPAGESAFFGTGWHSDNSFFERPTSFTILYGETLPPYGGDTLFASMTRAYDALSPALKSFLEPLRAVHSASRAYDPRTTGTAKYEGKAAITYSLSDAIYAEVEHPVIRTHAETGRKGLYVNPMFTLRVCGLGAVESDGLLALLYAHATRPDFTCRFRWEPGSLAIWDNRCTQHYALDDYQPFERVMYRVTLAGERPL